LDENDVSAKPTAFFIKFHDAVSANALRSWARPGQLKKMGGDLAVKLVNDRAG
jgi:hypothetical protein